MPKVYRFQKYDIRSDDMVESTRMATAEKIKRLAANIVGGSERDVEG